MKNDHDRIVDRLTELSVAPVPALTNDRFAAIERRVLAAVAEPVAEPATRPHRRAAPFALAFAAAALIFVVAWAALSAPPAELRIDVADGVVLELPDGRTALLAAGDQLPEGSVIDVGGAAIIDGASIPPGRYVVVDGVLVPLSGGTTSTTSTTTTSTTVATPATRPTPIGDPPAPAPVPNRTTTTVIDRRPAPISTRPRDDRPVDRDRITPTTTTVDRPRPTTTVADRPSTTIRTATTTRPTTTRPTPTVADRLRDRREADPTTTIPRRGGRDGMST